MIEADYQLLCDARRGEMVAHSSSRKRRVLLCLAVLLVLSFPVLF